HAQQQPEKKLGWQLGSQAYTFNRFSFAEALDKIDSCGLKFVEAYPGQVIGGGIEGKMDYNMDADKRKQVLALLKSKGIKLVSFGVIGTRNEADWEKIFEFADAMGIRNITAEPEEAHIPTISRLCDKYKINLAIHN